MGIFVLILHFPVICLCFPMVLRLNTLVSVQPFIIVMPRGGFILFTLVGNNNHPRG